MKKDAPQPVRPVSRKLSGSPSTINEWTVMIYMAADNNLSEESVWALTELQEMPLAAGVRIVVLFDSCAHGMPTRIYTFGSKALKDRKDGYIPERKTRRGRLLDDGTDFSIEVGDESDGRQTKLKRNLSAADRRVLEAFISEILDDPELRARHYAVVFSGHGSGAIGDFLTAQTPGGALSIPDVGTALGKIVQHRRASDAHFEFDIIGMDSCLMNMAEVSYELRDVARFLVGAEGFAPETGWPYREVIEAVNRAATSKGEGNEIAGNLACEIVEAYIDYYSDYAIAGTSVDQSVCDLRRLGAFQEKLKALAGALEKGLNTPGLRDAIILAHWRAQSYKNEQYTDLWDFCDLLGSSCDDAKLREKCLAVIAALEGSGPQEPGVVLLSRYYGVAFQHSHGVSIYFPWKRTAELDEYQKLAFAIETGWGAFLARYVEVTQREVRGEARLTANGKLVKTVRKVSITAVETALAPVAVTPPAIRTPPDTGRTPPDTGKTPPDTGRLKAQLKASMKNQPSSFLIERKTGTAVD